MQVLQARAWLDTQFFGQRSSRVPVGRQRFGLTMVLIEGEHEKRVKPLSQWVLASEPPELRDHVGVPAKSQLRAQLCLQHLQPQLR